MFKNYTSFHIEYIKQFSLMPDSIKIKQKDTKIKRLVILSKILVFNKEES